MLSPKLLGRWPREDAQCKERYRSSSPPFGPIFLALHVVVQDLLDPAVSEFDRKLFALEVGNRAITKLWMRNVVTDRVFRRSDAGSSLFGGCCFLRAGPAGFGLG